LPDERNPKTDVVYEPPPDRPIALQQQQQPQTGAATDDPD
jgi:hypothetical protein